jgi:uncharacterized membrane protein
MFSVTTALVIGDQPEVSEIMPAAEVPAVLAALVADLHGGEVDRRDGTRRAVTGQERGQDPLFAFRLLADIGMQALSPAVNDPATAVQVLDTIESLLRPLVSRDLDVAEMAASTGATLVVALPSSVLSAAPMSRQLSIAAAPAR